MNAGSVTVKSQKKSQAFSSNITLSTPSSNSGIDTNSIIQLALAKVSPSTKLLSPDHELAQTLSIFTASFSRSGSYADSSGDLKSFMSWLGCIPSHLGKNSALDGAVACLSLHSIGTFSQSPNLTRESFRFYGKALYWLRQNLKSNHLALAPETVCATIILSIFEVRNSWISCQKKKTRAQDLIMAFELAFCLY